MIRIARVLKRLARRATDSRLGYAFYGGEMKRIVVPNGGHTGTMIETENGVRSVQPFEPEVLHLLKAVANLVRAASTATNAKESRSLARHSTTIANLAIQQIEKALGPLDDEACVLYYDEDGGFTCGSTGKVPIPFPWPPQPIPSIKDFLAAGVVEKDLLDYIEKGRASGLTLRRLFEAPEAVAQELKIDVSDKTIADLKQLDPASPITLKDPVDREVLEFFHRVVEDGRYVLNWFGRPYETAHSLGIELSDEAMERLLARGSMAWHGPSGGGPQADFGVSVITVSVADAVIVYIVATKSRPIEEVVVNRSASEKI
jgi:hypothetical protein